MSLERIVLADDAIGASITDERGHRPAEPGEIYGYERLAAALRGLGFADVATGARIPYPAGPERDAGTAVVMPATMLRDVEEHATAGGRLGPRVVLAAADRTHMLERVERYKLAGAVDIMSWQRWDRASLTGRLDVGRAMGANVDDAPPFASEHYGWLTHPAYPDLPSLLLAYLRAYFA